jgi:hypothetical protein
LIEILVAFRTQVRVYRRDMTADPAANPMTREDWIPASCTLPTGEQPLRRKEFDELFAHDVRAVHAESPDRIRLELHVDPGVAARAASLAVKEAGCCSFFAFELAIGGGTLSLAISTAPGHEEALAALRGTAESRLGGVGS